MRNNIDFKFILNQYLASFLAAFSRGWGIIINHKSDSNRNLKLTARKSNSEQGLSSFELNNRRFLFFKNDARDEQMDSQMDG